MEYKYIDGPASSSKADKTILKYSEWLDGLMMYLVTYKEKGQDKNYLYKENKPNSGELKFYA